MTLHDEDSDEATKCPHCGSTGSCPHLLAVLDLTNGTCAGGFLGMKHLNAIEGLLCEGFIQARKAGGTVVWRDPNVAELWAYARENDEGEDTMPVIDRAVLLRLFRSGLEAAGAEEAPGRPVDDGEGPGNESALAVYFAADPSAVFDEATRVICEPLVATLDQLSSRSKRKPTPPRKPAKRRAAKKPKAGKGKAPPKRRRARKDVSPRR